MKSTHGAETHRITPNPGSHCSFLPLFHRYDLPENRGCSAARHPGLQLLRAAKLSSVPPRCRHHAHWYLRRQNSDNNGKKRCDGQKTSIKYDAQQGHAGNFPLLFGNMPTILFPPHLGQARLQKRLMVVASVRKSRRRVKWRRAISIQLSTTASAGKDLMCWRWPYIEGGEKS